MTRRLLPLLLFALPATAADPPFRFADGERVVWLGSTLVEREQKYGHWEYHLTVANAPRKVTFRNLGWSGDTVFGEARNAFDANPKGFERLVSLTLELKPTVAVVCYGHNESFAGPAGVKPFAVQLNKLLDAIAPANARIVLMSPTPFENLPPVMVDADAKNKNLALYRDAIRATADARKLQFVDLFDAVQRSRPTARTDNGLHYTAAGYRETARLLTDPSAGFADTQPAEDADLLGKIVAKNRLFFHRWRPQNETYLFGFRKHEQGQNAKEIVQFDPLVAAAEDAVAARLKSLTR